MDLVQLLVRLGITGEQTVKTELGNIGEAVDKAGEGARRAATAFTAFDIPLVRVAASAVAVTGALTTLTAGLTALSGIKLAADYQRIEMGFANLLHSARAAHQLVADLRRMGTTTPFETADLVRFSKILLSTGSTASEVTRQMGLLADAVAAVGGQTADVGQLAEVLARIRIMPHADLRELIETGLLAGNLGEIVGAGTGKGAMTGNQAVRTLEGMSGQRAFDVIFRGIQATQGGAADRLGAQSLEYVLHNLGETIRNVMVPSGAALLPVLGLAAELLMTVGGWVQRINEVTGGSAGLIVLFGGLYRVKNLLIGSLIKVVAMTREFTQSLEALVVAEKAAGVAKAATVGGAEAGAAAADTAAEVKSVGGLKGIIAWFKTIPELIKTVKVADLALAAGKGLLGILKGFWSFLIDIVGSFVGDKIGGWWGNLIKEISSGIGLGGGIGALFEGVGAIPGAIIGGIGGAIKAIFFDKADSYPGADKQAQIEQNTRAAANSLQDIRGHLIGGGRRTTQRLEDTLAYMMASGVG